MLQIHTCQSNRPRTMLDVLMSKKNILKSIILDICRKNQTTALLDNLCWDFLWPKSILLLTMGSYLLVIALKHCVPCRKCRYKRTQGLLFAWTGINQYNSIRVSADLYQIKIWTTQYFTPSHLLLWSDKMSAFKECHWTWPCLGHSMAGLWLSLNCAFSLQNQDLQVADGE